MLNVEEKQGRESGEKEVEEISSKGKAEKKEPNKQAPRNKSKKSQENEAITTTIDMSLDRNDETRRGESHHRDEGKEESKRRKRVGENDQAAARGEQEKITDKKPRRSEETRNYKKKKPERKVKTKEVLRYKLNKYQFLVQVYTTTPSLIRSRQE